MDSEVFRVFSISSTCVWLIDKSESSCFTVLSKKAFFLMFPLFIYQVFLEKNYHNVQGIMLSSLSFSICNKTKYLN